MLHLRRQNEEEEEEKDAIPLCKTAQDLSSFGKEAHRFQLVYLKKIETRGFKSMGASLVSVPIERGLVAITGPNGSGKSNLLDAILFCLGENSAKTLRVPNLSALIYDANEGETKPSSAKVSLQFDNTDRRIPLDSDTVTITRELKSSGESVYYLNGKHVQRNTLSDLLEMALITSRGLNIVLQGMITRVSELVPDEKRKLIEQMVGVSQFDEKKEEALKQLQEADNKLAVALAKIEEIRDQVQHLEEQRNDQLRLKQLEEITRWLKAVSISGKLIELRKMRTARSQQIAQLEVRWQELQGKFSEIKVFQEDLEKERDALVRSAVDFGTAQVEAEIGAVKSELERLTQQREESSKLVENLIQVIPALTQMRSSQEEKISLSLQRISELERKIFAAQNLKKTIVLEQEALSKQRQSLDDEIAKEQSRLNRLRKLKETHDERMMKKQTELSSLELAVRSAKERLSALNEKSKFFSENLSGAKASLSELQSILESQQIEAEKLDESRQKVENLSRKLESQLEIALAILEKASTAVIRYDSELSAIQNVAPDEIAMSKLGEIAKREGIEGYYGTVSEIIDYPPGFRDAISALGKDWLGAVVVQDMKSLTRVVEAAKKEGISKITVIPVEEVRGSENVVWSRRVKKVRPAAHVISCDPRFRGIVNFIFGDSFIVSSPKEAYVIARRGFRAATKNGDIFEPELIAFETGYARRFAKIADALDQKESFDKIKSALVSLKALIERRKESLSYLRSKSENFADDIALHRIDMSKTEAKLDSAKQSIVSFVEYSKSFQAKAEETRREIQKLEGMSEKAQRVLRAYSKASERLWKIIGESDLSRFDLKLQDLNQKKANLNSRLDAAIYEINELSTELTKEKGRLENDLKPGLERLKEQIHQSEGNLSSKQSFLAESEPKLRDLESKLETLKLKEAELLEKASHFQASLDELENKIKRSKSELESQQRLIYSTQKELDSAKMDVERLSESENILLGELTMNGYSEPIDPFEGADQLLKELSSEAESLRGNVNNLADQYYREVFDNYKNSSLRHNELEKERNAIVNFIETIDSEKRKVFVEAYDKINRELGTIFKKMTGGSAWLDLEKPDDIFSGGIFLMTQFPSQLPRDSSSVSGGQKTVSALSFILAIQAVFPSPFYVFDEVDAALDSVYSGKMAEILQERSAFSQIIIVSLKDTVVSKASTVIGVYMSQGCSKVLRYKNPMEVAVLTE